MKTSIAIGALALAAIAGSANAGIVDPFTTAQTGGNPGTAPWLNVPGSLFAERQLQRGNNAIASIGSGAWTMGPNQSSGPTQNGISNLNYRQDDAGSTINLSAIASMSFNFNVTGSVNLNWYLEDANNGLYLSLAGALVSVSGTGTQTLNFSTAIIDLGFDLSSVTGMSVQFSGISAGESATVTNFTYTLVPTPGAATLLGLGGLLAARRRR
jgi:hypothetical protein